MSGVSSPVYGSYNGSSGAKLPSSVAYFAGEVRNNPVDLEDGATLVAACEMKMDSGTISNIAFIADITMLVASTDIATDTQISGGLWAVATGFEFRDGTNVAVLETTWANAETIALALHTSAFNSMCLQRI